MSEPSHTMSVRDIMAVNVVTIQPDALILEVARLMAKMDIGSVVVVDGHKPVGIITESDIVRRVIAAERDPTACIAKEVMSSPIIHVTSDTPLTEAMRVMARSGIRRLIVLKNDSLAGIITSRDILRWSPELIDVLVESLRLREGPTEGGAETEAEEDELVAYGGICDVCGEYSTDLVFEDGKYLCESCRR